MSGLVELRRLEQWMTYVRWFGVVFGAVAVSLQPFYPDDATRSAAWTIIAVLGLGSALIWGALARIGSDRALERLGAFAYGFDVAVIMGLVWVFAYETPYVTWALLFLVPMEGALRYRLKGALSGATAVALFFVPQSIRRADLIDGSFDATTYIFVAGLATLVAGIIGAMAEAWHSQTRAYRSQSLKFAEVDRLKDQFLAVTSHEIRGPLTAIITGVDTVWRRAARLTSDQRDALMAMVSQQAHQLARLVDDLLVTSQLQKKSLSLQVEEADLQGTVDQALEAAASKRRGHQLEIFVEPLRCELDASRVGQIVRNLVENAYKYTPDRTRVAVTAKRVDGGIEVEVTDEGPGIPPDKRDRLFAAFSRIEETAAGQEGVGLGLYVVSQLIAVMGGRIDLASSSRGTKFAINIPCRAEPLAPPRFGVVQGDAP
ncbi:MAG: sensor histidine kinase [Actinomycetota bacterium]